MNDHKNITLKDVAMESGVSVPTVSRVVNQEKYVSDEVKTKVEKAIKKLNYRPEWTARSLRLRKTDTIGVIIPNVADYFFGSVVLTVEKFFREKGKDIILFCTLSDEKMEEKALELAVSKRVDGIILITISKSEDAVLSIIDNFGIPIIIVDNKLKTKNLDQVLSDDVGGSIKLIDHLIRVHGHNRIACISGPLDESSGLDKLIGYKNALQSNGIQIEDKYIEIANWKKSEAYKATEKLMKLDKRPEAIYCVSANMLIGCLRYLIDNGIRVPEDVALVTFDDYDFVSVLYPPVTSLERIDIRMGKKSAELLFKRINGDKEKYKEVKISSDLIIRRSCGCN